MKQTAARLLIFALLLSCLAGFTACGKQEGDPSQGTDKPATDRVSPSKGESEDDPQKTPSDKGEDGKTDVKNERPSDVWDGSVDTEWYEKSKQDFQIGTAEQLAGLAKIVNQLDSTKTNASPPTINVTLTADLDLAGLEWTPIGVEKECKAIGTFDGAGYTVSGFQITDGETAPGYVGLFGYCYFDVKNLGVEGFTIQTSTERKVYVGGLAGYTIASVTDCHAAGDISVIAAQDLYAGGLIGMNYGGTVSGCYAEGSVTAESTYDVPNSDHCFAYVGGLLGFNQGEVTSCYATALVGGSAAMYGIDVGGFVGRTIVAVTDCYATGAVNAACFGQSTVSAGGFAGRINTMVESCYATGNVTVTARGDYAAGGFCGSISGELTDCYRTDTQVFWIMQPGATSHAASNESGTAESPTVIRTADFHKTTLGWDETVWSLADGELPTLK